MEEETARKKIDLFIPEATANQLMGILEAVGKVKDKTERKPVPGAVVVPGSPAKGYLVAAEFVTDTLADLVRFFLRLHYLKLSFDGQLTLDEIFWTPDGSIRLLESAQLKLKGSTPVAEKNDMQSLATSVKGNLFDGKTLPTDVAHLLNLLENHYSHDAWVAVYNHPGLLWQGEKLSQFELLYMSYRYVEKLDSAKHARIIAKMPHCKVDLSHWKYKALDNVYPENILFYTQDIIHPQSRKYNAATKKKKGRPYKLPSGLGATDAFRINRAMIAGPNVAQDCKLTQELRRYVRATMKTPLPPIPIDPAGDRELLIKLVLDDISQYNNEGDGMLRDIRNSFHHITDEFLKKLPAQPAAAAAPAPPPAAAALAAVTKFHEVESIFGEEYPGALCEFFMAMISEQELDYVKDVQTYLSHLSR